MPLEYLPPLLEDFEDEAILYSLSSEFLEVARVLLAAPASRLKYSIVVYYLCGRAAELLLKRFLFSNGDSIEYLKNRYGHDLKLLVKCARLKGLPKNVSTKKIQKLGNVYTKKHTEYRQKKQLQFPALSLLFSEIDELKTHVFSRIGNFDSAP